MSVTLPIEGELTVFTAHALKDSLMAAFEADAHVHVDLSGVSEVDGAGVQLLMAAKREARERGASLTLSGHPPQLIAALELADLAREFGDALVLDQEATA
jgi:anti-sigma B factor antagonist